MAFACNICYRDEHIFRQPASLTDLTLDSTGGLCHRELYLIRCFDTWHTNVTQIQPVTPGVDRLPTDEVCLAAQNHYSIMLPSMQFYV